MNRIASLFLAALLPCAAAVAQTTASVALSANPADGGRVTGSGTYTIGATVSIVATASNGWKFVGWSDGSAVASRKIVVGADGTNLTAGFAMATGTLSFNTLLVNAGDVPIKYSGTASFTVSNGGTGAVTVSGITIPKGFSASPTKFTLPGGGSQLVTVTFKPSAVAVVSGTVVLKSNAARIDGSLGITGNGVAQTRVVRIEGDADCGEISTTQTASRVITVYNDGNSPMSISGISWLNNADKSFSASPTKLTIAAGGSGQMTVSFSPKMAQRYDTTTLNLVGKSLTGGTTSIAVSGGGTAGVQGTWSGTIANSSGSISATAYVWQDGLDVVAYVTSSRVTGIFAGTVTNRAYIVGEVWTNDLYVGAITLTFAAGPKLSGATSNGAVNVNLTRKSTTIPSTVTKPDVSSLPVHAALPLPPVASPAATFTVFAAADGSALAAAADGSCATWALQDGRMAVGFAQEVASGIPLVAVETEGEDANANDLPDAFEAALGGLPPDGTPLVVVRLADGVLTLETPFTDALRVDGAPVPATQLPASWKVTPVMK